MGFNLVAFFEELNLIINNTEYSEAERLEAIAAEVTWQQKYALQCGQI